MAIAWSGARTVQNNYQLQKQISALQQQNAVLHLQNNNTYLQNQFYDTEVYQELSARQNLGLAAPGEQVLLIPKSVAMKYVDPALASDSENDSLNTITLSYTFYPVRDPAPKPVAAGEPDKRKGSL